MIKFHFNNIVNNLFFGFFWILLMFVLKKTIFKKFSEKFNYYIWLPLMVVMIIPLEITVTRKIPIILQNKVNITKILNSEIIKSNVYEKNILDYIAIIYISIIVLIITFELANYFILRRKVIKESIIINDEMVNGIYNKVKKELKVRSNSPLMANKKLSTPMNIGMFSQNIILSSTKYTSKELELILKHELIHQKRYDFLYKLLMSIACAVNWINPLVYLMVKDIKYYCESSCDEEVINKSSKDEIKTYGLVIAKTARNNAYGINRNLSFSLNEKDLTVRRVKTMFDEKKKFKGNIALFIASLFIILSFGIFVLNIEYVVVQASENNNVIKSEEFKEKNEIEKLENLNDVESLTKFFEKIMTSGDKKVLESFLEENNIKYNENNTIINFNYKDRNILLDYYDNSLRIIEK
ncbi:MAG: M56 family metallopeptidase [Clostridium sp.]|nr:M56 family metallopeptidase [Clostridium sp.]MCI7444294.1 M56 family metallopeptidase [Clostridium sp.]